MIAIWRNGRFFLSLGSLFHYLIIKKIRLTMPFGLVSAWNKRRRSRSLEQGDPCNTLFFFFDDDDDDDLVRSFSKHKLLSGTYKAIEFRQLEDHHQISELPTKKRNGSSVFTLKEMENATCSFTDDNLIGKGGFGRVYKGILRSGEVRITNLLQSCHDCQIKFVTLQ